MQRLLMAALAFSLVAGVAQAQTTVIQGKDRTVYKPKTVLEFGNVEIDGVPEGSGVGHLRGKTKVKFSSMIRLRANFNPELAESVNHL